MVDPLSYLEYLQRRSRPRGTVKGSLRNMNRRWEILQFLLENGATIENLDYGKDFGLTTSQVAKGLGISSKNAFVTLKRLQSQNMVIKIGKYAGKWYLSYKALRFVKQYGSFLNHPWVVRYV